MAAFSTDQNVKLRVAELLRSAGYDVRTARELGLESAGDEEHLLCAAFAGRVLVTYNRKDFELMHDAWLRWSRVWGIAQDHAGVLILPQPLAPKESARAVAEIVARPEPLTNTLHVWSAAGGWARRRDV